MDSKSIHMPTKEAIVGFSGKKHTAADVGMVKIYKSPRKKKQIIQNENF